ncbi:putative ino80-like protein [Zalerion maritima]|uniref:Chromatin-remodeling ATPase INO80 n=1 Tax=Zalerion maritima TaxID=339359 RepID=A0AAD5RSB9_9PEZI|nr:putative ino80-like protein [Zalerion maritima]
MESNYRSTVLHRPPTREEESEHRGPGHRDILNPAPLSPVGTSQPQPPHHSFSLRSPTQPEYHQPRFSSPTSSSTNQRPALHNPFMAAPTGAPTVPPPSVAAPPPHPPVTSVASGPISPLHAPPYYSSQRDEYHQQQQHMPREKPATSSFYDPTTDTTKERRVSESGSWHNSAVVTTPQKQTSHEPYGSYSQHQPQQHQSQGSPVEPPSSVYYNNSHNGGGGAYTSPSSSNAKYAAGPRSPAAAHHSHPVPPQGSVSPPVTTRAPQISSPGIRDLSMPGTAASASTANPTTTSSSSNKPNSIDSIITKSELGTASSQQQTQQQTLQTPEAASTTPSRAAQLMSLNNILSSGTETVSSSKPKTLSLASPKSPKPAPVAAPAAMPAEKKERAPRKSKTHTAKDPDAPTRGSRKSAAAAETPSVQPRIPAKRQANGQPKPKTLSADKEKRIQALMSQMDVENPDTSFSDLESDLGDWHTRCSKRRRLMNDEDSSQRITRRSDFSNVASHRLSGHQEVGKRRYDEVFYNDAMHQVREAEILAEKERKKDMQRKRRREKSMAVTIEQKEAALEKARAAEDETERQKHLREAERANKKAQQTKLILQKGIKGPARNIANVELNLEGGTMSTFSANDGDAPKKGKSGRGARPKKSKEQKQAEKDSAEAAQAALDAGLELPPKDDTPKIKLKTTKSKDKAKDKARDKDADQDGHNDEGAEAKHDEKDKEHEVVKEKEPKKKKAPEEPPPPPEKFASKGYHQIYDQIWRDMSRKDVTKVFRLAGDSYTTRGSNLKKTAILASKEAKRWQLRTNKGQKDMQARAKRVMRDMMSFWKRNEREERDLRKAAERQELENARQEEAKREAARQKRKLNFLISQTELYSHFIGKKIKTTEVERSTDHPDEAKDDKQPNEQPDLDVQELAGPVGDKVTNFESLDFESDDEDALKAAAMANAQNAIAEAQQKARDFNKEADLDEDGEMNFQNPTGLGDVEIEQPKLLNCQLKEYQVKGLNWLANLYEQGINGILADEMGLGKTVQSISVMAYLAEKYDVWGPFLVVSPASTLHNWQQEIARFVPEFKVLPYWGTVSDRKVLRKFWDRKHSTYKKDAPFHVMVTSYQMVVSDVSYFQKMRWQYMILDEAQAIKSSESSRWKCLLGFHCRNRLLLTGTPIQNNMQELWALLHFIMPSLFDSHDEFSEWFSKDIESHAQSNTKLNEDQLKRLHMILKPFMLRRVKKHVQKELGDKIEKDVFCELTYRQRAYYANLRNQISIMDLIEKATIGDDNDSSTLMNLVMQFRKVCNHPDLFERSETTSPLSFSYYAVTGSFIREGNKVTVGYSTRNMIDYELPRQLWCEGGRIHKAGKDNDKAGHRNKLLDNTFNIWSPKNVLDSTSRNDTFSFLRFADTNPGEAHQAGTGDIFARAANYMQKPRQTERLRTMSACFEGGFTPAHALFMIKAQRDVNAKAEVASDSPLSGLLNISRESWRDKGFSRLEAAARPSATAPPIEVVSDSPAAVVERQQVLFNVRIRRALYGPNPVEQMALVTQKIPLELQPPPEMLPAPDNEKNKYTTITVPSMRRFVTDSGKLAKLDELLFMLKEGGHRVLLYFQMTRMIDLMEEYLTYRNWKYCRLDGSTKLEDRRDTVHDFQTRPEIFIFLLSTRAGGLGINLTSADTVIFYDSDWNPTIDSQAMDRAHRLGQTKQVTVYRLITRGTIEERIRKRALQKEEVQRVVISGGGAAASGVDFSGRRAPENRNRDIAMWLADDEQAEMIEKREKELLESAELEKGKKKPGKRKRAPAANNEGGVSLDDMYHEGEGRFDDEKQSGTATPVVEATADGPKPKRARKGSSKKAKSIKQRLAIADGDVHA